MSKFEVLTLFVAAYGAVLSTLLAIRQLRAQRRALKVSCRLAVTSQPTGEISELVSIIAVNTGVRPVEVKMAGLLMSNKDLFTQVASRIGPNPLPKKLEDGESVTIFFDLSKARLSIRDADIPGLRYTRAVVQDAEGRQYTSDVPAGIHIPPNPFFKRPGK
jgi:hypothetical protein